MKPPYLPMLAKDAPAKDTPIPGAGWTIEPKLDGWRWIIHVTDDGVRSWSGRHGVERTGAAKRVEADCVWLPPDTVIDGELITGDGKRFNGAGEVSTALARGGPLTYVVFDVLRLGGEETYRMPWYLRRSVVVGMDNGFSGSESVRVGDNWPTGQVLHERWLDEGFEGSIAKRVDAPYRPGMKDAAFTKFKPQDSDDAIVVGFVAGKGSLKGQVGAFEIRVLKTGSLSSVAIGDEERKQLREVGPDAYLGRLIEFRHHGLNADSGKPRNPIFVCRRDD